MTGPTMRDDGDDPGVPEALPRTIVAVRDRFGTERVDRLWVFPPLRRGRRETGVLAVSLFGVDDERRRLVTVAYQAERRGLTLTVEHTLHEEGEALPELLPRVMEGVVRRAGGSSADPRLVEIGGSADTFASLIGEFDPKLLPVPAS